MRRALLAISTFLLFTLAMGTLGRAQPAASEAPARWQTILGGDAQGDYVRVTRPVDEGTLRGRRTVERVTPRVGVTTGGETAIVLSGSEPEAQRTVSVHLPYGARLDLAAGESVEVELASRRAGLGAVHEVRIARGGSAVVLATSAARSSGVSVRRGAEARDPSHPGQHRYGLEVTIARHRYALEPGRLYQIDERTIALGGETTYDAPRPPDAIDERTFTLVRLAPTAPLPPGADS